MRLSPLHPLVLLTATALPAQETGLVAFRQACLDAATDGVVLNIAAHPDDEAARTMVMLRRRFGLRTVTLYTTYGDGGQNAVGHEIGDELAAIRVRETLAASRHNGIAVRWLGFDDFGYSKTLAETLEWWGREALLEAMRGAFAQIRPDVVFTNHSLERGHGHHRASRWAIGRVLEEHRERAGRTVPLFQRSSRENQHFELDPYALDPVRGETFARQAHRGLLEHRTQGPWRAHDPLRQRRDRWRLVFPEVPGPPEAGANGGGAEASWEPPVAVEPWPHVRSVFDLEAARAALAAEGAEVEAVERSLAWLARAAPVRTAVDRARELLPVLRAARDRCPGEGEARRRMERRIDALQRVVLHGSGLEIETWLADEVVPAGGEGTVHVAVHGAAPFADLEVYCGGRGGEPVSREDVRAGGPVRRLEVGFEAAPSPGPEPSWVGVSVACTVDDLPLRLERRLPYTAVPPLELHWDRDEVMVPAGEDVERVFSLAVTWHGGEVLEVPVRLGIGPGLEAEAIPGRVSLSPQRPEARVLLRVAVSGEDVDGPADLSLTLGETRSELRLVPVARELDPDLRVGLVRGPDDTLHDTLADLGVPFRVLDVGRLAVTDLGAFSTLVLDMRTYHHRPDLAEHRERLLRFCRAGGRIVVLYHKPHEWNERPGRPLLAPFPLHVSRLRVTEEDAPVELLAPEHPVWNRPHAIGPGDFEGWVQERGLYFADRWDPGWTPLIAMKDSGEEEMRRGAMLYTDYGQGQYLYCTLALYRQLRRGHAGAVRILMNLLTPE